MIFTSDTLKNIKSASDVKYALNSDSHFFDRNTMRFFGDKMTSFGIRTIDGMRVMYRKPSAMVNVFGTWKRTGKDYFSAWQLVPHGDHIEISPLTKEQQSAIYSQL